MSAYSGRYYRGASRERKLQKREEAEARQVASQARTVEAMKAFSGAAVAAAGGFAELASTFQSLGKDVYRVGAMQRSAVTGRYVASDWTIKA